MVKHSANLYDSMKRKKGGIGVSEFRADSRLSCKWQYSCFTYRRFFSTVALCSPILNFNYL